MFGGNGDDTLMATGDVFGLYGGDGNDNLMGTQTPNWVGESYLYGEGGDDILVFHGFNPWAVVYGGAGADGFAVTDPDTWAAADTDLGPGGGDYLYS